MWRPSRRDSCTGYVIFIVFVAHFWRFCSSLRVKDSVFLKGKGDLSLDLASAFWAYLTYYDTFVNKKSHCWWSINIALLRTTESKTREIIWTFLLWEWMLSPVYKAILKGHCLNNLLLTYFYSFPQISVVVLGLLVSAWPRYVLAFSTALSWTKLQESLECSHCTLFLYRRKIFHTQNRFQL